MVFFSWHYFNFDVAIFISRLLAICTALCGLFDEIYPSNKKLTMVIYNAINYYNRFLSLNFYIVRF
jgi:hypothetical protein